MATIGTAVTLQDFKSRLDDDNRIDMIIDLLTDQNEVLEDMLWLECNQVTSHKTTVRTGLPTVTWRKLNQGVPSSKSTTRQTLASCGMLESYGKVDKALADLNGNSAAWRMSEESAYIEAFNQELASTLFQGDTEANPEEFLGLNYYYDTPSSDEDLSGYNMIDGGAADGQNDTTSIWLICWGQNTVHGIYPKGSPAGLQVRDLGEDTLTDDNGNEYQGYRTHYKWDCGLVVRDWRAVGRIVNIDMTAVAAGTYDIINQMVRLEERVRKMGSTNCAWYMNKSLRTYLRLRALNNASSQLTFDTVAGKRVLAFGEYPVRVADGIIKTEAANTGTDFAYV